MHAANLSFIANSVHHKIDPVHRVSDPRSPLGKL